MGDFREGVVVMCWLSATLAGIFFWVVSLTTFMTHRSNNTSKSTSPSPSPAADGCSQDVLEGIILTYLRWMTAFTVSGILILFYVRWFVDTKATSETKAISIEDEARKAARDKLREAEDAAQDAMKEFLDHSSRDTLEGFVRAVHIRAGAAEKLAACVNSKEGMARLPRWTRYWVRLLFCLAILLSFGTGICAAVAFYYSLRLQVGCIDGVAEVVPFVFVGIPSVCVHFHALWVAVTKN